MNRAFQQVDVFGAEPLRGNPVAVVLDAAGLSEADMQAFARWTNLSETTFVLPPAQSGADYHVRIFTPAEELPFAGHPTLGTCHAWLGAGGQPRQAGLVMQACLAGLVPVRVVQAPVDGTNSAAARRLAFAAPPLRRQGPADAALRAQCARALRLSEADVRDVQWVDNGPGWVAVRLNHAQAVLDARIDAVELGELKLGVVGAYPAGAASQFEVRAFVGGPVCYEDPVTGSLNASLAQWMIGAGLAPPRYVASQGTVLGRRGRVEIEQQGDTVWVGGACRTVLHGQVTL